MRRILLIASLALLAGCDPSPAVQPSVRAADDLPAVYAAALRTFSDDATSVIVEGSKLTAAGATVLSENPGARQAFILLPDAIKIEFSEDKSLDKPVVHDHIHFAVPQIEEQRAWYEKTFGARLGMTGRFKAADVPGVNLRWNSAERRLPGIKGTSVDHIGFEVANLAAFCKNLEAEGVKFDVPYRTAEKIGLSIAFLTDPWGVYIELTEGLAALDKKAKAESP